MLALVHRVRHRCHREVVQLFQNLLITRLEDALGRTIRCLDGVGVSPGAHTQEHTNGASIVEHDSGPRIAGIHLRGEVSAIIREACDGGGLQMQSSRGDISGVVERRDVALSEFRTADGERARCQEHAFQTHISFELELGRTPQHDEVTVGRDVVHCEVEVDRVVTADEELAVDKKVPLERLGEDVLSSHGVVLCHEKTSPAVVVHDVGAGMLDEKQGILSLLKDL